MPQTVSLEEIAALLQGDDDDPINAFTPERVLLLVRLGYLKGDETKVVLPSPGEIRWLGAMLLPLPERPLFTLNEVVLMADIAPPKDNRTTALDLLRKICAAYAIPIHVDEAWGELMSPVSFIRLLDALFGYREPMRFDRAALVEWMRGLKTGKRLRCNLSYSRLLELEIRRVARLREPERTMRAVAFWESYYDAKTISNCLTRYRASVQEQMRVTEIRLGRLMKKITGQEILLPETPLEPPAPAEPSEPGDPPPPPSLTPQREPTS